VRITEHFSREEFVCADSTPVPAEYIANLRRLCIALEELRARWGRPLRITSGYRTALYNRRVGGARKSQHLTASAADITIDDVNSQLVANAAIELGFGGVGRYPTFTHVDVRMGRKARWGSNARKEGK
jgi:uncharacterized protein YcbK (DUF882 family)